MRPYFKIVMQDVQDHSKDKNYTSETYYNAEDAAKEFVMCNNNRVAVIFYCDKEATPDTSVMRSSFVGTNEGYNFLVAERRH